VKIYTNCCIDFVLGFAVLICFVLPKIKNPRAFVWDMFSKYKVITYLGEWFGANDRVRFSYALDIKKIDII
jgi:aspartate/methionine/tyrosine aminotransferase